MILRIPHPFTWPIVHQIRRKLHDLKYARLIVVPSSDPQDIKSGYQWWAGSSEEHYTEGPFNTRAEAIEAGEEVFYGDDGFYIIEASLQDLKLSWYFEARDFIQEVEENRCDDLRYDDETVFETTNQQECDLEEMVRATIDAWQIKHGLHFGGKAFINERNKEFVPVIAPESAGAA